jgi:hypothetical protein
MVSQAFFISAPITPLAILSLISYSYCLSRNRPVIEMLPLLPLYPLEIPLDPEKVAIQKAEGQAGGRWVDFSLAGTL